MGWNTIPFGARRPGTLFLQEAPFSLSDGPEEIPPSHRRDSPPDQEARPTRRGVCFPVSLALKTPSNVIFRSSRARGVPFILPLDVPPWCTNDLTSRPGSPKTVPIAAHRFGLPGDFFVERSV